MTNAVRVMYQAFSTVLQSECWFLPYTVKIFTGIVAITESPTSCPSRAAGHILERIAKMQ